MAAKKKAMDPRPTPPPKKTKLQTETQRKMSDAQKRLAESKRSTPDTQTEAIKKILTLGRAMVKAPGKYVPFMKGRGGLASIMEKEMSKIRTPARMRDIPSSQSGLKPAMRQAPKSSRKPAPLKSGSAKPKPSNKKY